MDSMELDLVMEVPDTPDRLAMVCLQEDGSEDAARRAHFRSRRNFGLHAEGTRPRSSNTNDDESLFRKARLACLISKSEDSALPMKTWGVSLEHENERVRSYGPRGRSERGIEKRGEVNDADKRLPFGSYPARVGDNRRKMAQDLHGENEDGRGHHLKGSASSATRPFRRVHNGVTDSSEPSDHVCTANGRIEIDLNKSESKHFFKESFAGSSCNRDETGFSNDLQTTSGKVTSKPLQYDAYPRITEKRRLVRNGCISPKNIAKNECPSVNRGSHACFAGKNVHDKGKGIDLSDGLQDLREKTVLRPCQFDSLKKNTGQRRLVRNGCISPLNTACRNRNGVDQPDGFFLPQLHVISPDSEPRRTHTIKEKEFLDGTTEENDQETQSHIPNRDLLMPGKDTINDMEAIADIVRPADEIGWRNTRNHTGKASQLPSQEASVTLNRKANSFHALAQRLESIREDKSDANTICPSHEVDSPEVTDASSFAHESNWSQFPETSDIIFELDSGIRSHFGAQRLRKGKRKSSSGHVNPGECSSSTFDIPEVIPRSSGGTSSANSQRHGITFGSIVDVDKLPSPLLRSTSPRDGHYIISEDSVARAQQVESDEMLARQLQEQFFNESPEYGGEGEIDASIAWTLQQEDDAQHESVFRNHGQPHPVPRRHRQYPQYPRRSSRNSSVLPDTRARINSSARMARLSRNMRHMDLEMRLDFWEVLEASFNDHNDPRVNTLQIQRDFNENDYEMLLSLDDDNHQHAGASLHQINSLPQSIVQTDNVEEACAICLETPTIGDTIRHLPCLHKFHKDCIDAWLKRRTSCPICKSGIA